MFHPDLDRLVLLDPDFGRIADQAGPMVWITRRPGFTGLLQAIAAQQISTHAASAIWRRIEALENACIPEGFLKLPDDALRGAGFSRPKIGHARAVAEAFASGLLATEALAAMEDEAAIEVISSVRGLGRWSAEIYLLFALGRPDVLPSGDMALQASAADLKGVSRPTDKALRAMAQAWAPHRGLAARMLWHWWHFRTAARKTEAKTRASIERVA